MSYKVEYKRLSTTQFSSRGEPSDVTDRRSQVGLAIAISFAADSLIRAVLPISVHHQTYTLPDGDHLTVVDDVLYGIDSTDNVSAYDRILRIPSRNSASYVAKRGLTVERTNGSIASCLLAFPGGSRMLPTNVLLHRGRLFVASGVALAAIDVPELSLSWTVDLQTGADNGLLAIGNDHVLAIGDFDATLIDWDGVVQWAINVPGVLVPPGTISGNVLSIDDDDGQTHRVDLVHGRLMMG
ncbi:MAG: hypothetical protein KDB00_11780 [Planctomycetales bacterium]|nr:hypothetical protein [Planctomycetales bacterium]